MMPRTWSSLTMRTAKGKPFYHWYCPKCGVAYHEDCKIVEEHAYCRLKHQCGSFLKPIPTNLFRGESLRGLEIVIDEIRKESKESKE